MGSSKSKPVREAPARFVAKQVLPRETKPAEDMMRKPEYSAMNINKRKDNVNTEPLMYVETAQDGTGTELTDHTSPRWYLNTYMEMIDNAREDRTIISGNLPASWERDKNEPYALVRGRIDDEDLDWLLRDEQRQTPLDELSPQCKLDRTTIEDIMATVELPRRQYRNYQGKLNRTIDEAPSFLEERKKQIDSSRESETLRRIGFSDEEINNDEQYRTSRSRGVRMLDDLGTSTREKRRMDKAFERTDKEQAAERRRVASIESGTYLPQEEELVRDPSRPLKSQWHGTMGSVRTQTQKNAYRLDIGKDNEADAKIDWWLDRSRRIKRGTDKIYGVPIYNERLQANEEQTRHQMKEAAQFNFDMGQRQGAKGYVDPRGQYSEMMELMRKRRDSGIDGDSVDVMGSAATSATARTSRPNASAADSSAASATPEQQEQQHEEQQRFDNGVDMNAPENIVFRFPHTIGHAAPPPQRPRSFEPYAGPPSWEELRTPAAGATDQQPPSSPSPPESTAADAKSNNPHDDDNKTGGGKQR